MNIQRFGVRSILIFQTAIAAMALQQVNKPCWSHDQRHVRWRLGSKCQQRRDTVAKRAAAKRRRQAIRRHRKNIA